MAARFLIPRTSKALNHLLHSTSTQIRPSIPRFFTTESLSPALDLDTRVPATIITGFLGSGKTTLLNHILTAQHGKRIAVIENEFGEVDIDSSLVADHSSVAEDIVMVNNGCLCCTVRGDLVKMLLKLVKKKRDKFDHIVIETTGLAKPSPVIDTFISDELVAQHVKLDGVVTLVDCKHAMQHLTEVKPRWVVNEAVEQVAYADRIILNKIDLVSKADLESVTKKIMHINGMAQIREAKFGAVDMDFVLGVGGYDIERIESEVQVNGNHDTSHHSHDGHVMEGATIYGQVDENVRKSVNVLKRNNVGIRIRDECELKRIHLEAAAKRKKTGISHTGKGKEKILYEQDVLKQQDTNTHHKGKGKENLLANQEAAKRKKASISHTRKGKEKILCEQDVLKEQSTNTHHKGKGKENLLANQIWDEALRYYRRLHSRQLSTWKLNKIIVSRPRRKDIELDTGTFYRLILRWFPFRRC